VKREHASEVALVVCMALAALAFASRGVAGDAPLIRLMDDAFLLRFACVLKLLFLLVGAWLALHNSARFGAGNPIRPAWLLLGLGLGATFLGQAVLAVFQLSPAAETPFPSLADAFFVLGYPLFIAALVSFGRAYDAAGYPLGTRRARWTAGAVATLAGLVVAAFVLTPIVLKPAPLLQKSLNVAYPVLDLAVLVPTILLFRASLPLRGGEVWKAWAALLAGFFFMSAGDVLFAYFQALDVTHVDPLVHVTYLLSYGFLALGVVRQSRLLAS
jgi:hypothetical protein